MSIPFTQYLMPNGRKVPVTIEMEPDVETRAKALIDRGCHFDIEMLNTGVISMTCENSEYEEEIISIVLCENDKTVVESVRKLVAEATETLTILDENKAKELAKEAAAIEAEPPLDTLGQLIERLQGLALFHGDDIPISVTGCYGSEGDIWNVVYYDGINKKDGFDRIQINTDVCSG